MTTKTLAESAVRAVEALKAQASGLEDELRRLLGEIAKYEAIDAPEALAFLKEPWCILPKSREEWWVVIPRWIGVQVGWLERSTETYNVFVVNRYSHWLGGIPPQLRERLQLPEPVQATVQDGRLRAASEVARKLHQHVGEGNEETGFKIIRGHEFDLMADLIKMGSIPFVPHAVDPADLWEKPDLRGPLRELRDYQEEGWSDFRKRGAVGIYWPFGMGKTVLGAYAIARLKGIKLVVCPTRTLVEQWERRVREWTAEQFRTRIVTYNAWKAVQHEGYALVIFDEAHRLPANTFSRLATVRAKYRIGLSGSPYREDGRTNYIFALTGYPVGVDWTRFVRSGLIRKPQVAVQIVRGGWSAKTKIVEEEAAHSKGKVLVFCDSIAPGRQIATRLRCPHVWGSTKNRLETIAGARVTVVSRVGDEGLSIPDLKTVIEVDFLGGSRRQEAQRAGRLFHANGHGEHLVLMTPEEYDKFEGRFLALEEKGIKVEVRE